MLVSSSSLPSRVVVFAAPNNFSTNRQTDPQETASVESWVAVARRRASQNLTEALSKRSQVPRKLRNQGEAIHPLQFHQPASDSWGRRAFPGTTGSLRDSEIAWLGNAWTGSPACERQVKADSGQMNIHYMVRKEIRKGNTDFYNKSTDHNSLFPRKIRSRKNAKKGLVKWIKEINKRTEIISKLFLSIKESQIVVILI